MSKKQIAEDMIRFIKNNSLTHDLFDFIYKDISNIMNISKSDMFKCIQVQCDVDRQAFVDRYMYLLNINTLYNKEGVPIKYLNNN